MHDLIIQCQYFAVLVLHGALERVHLGAQGGDHLLQSRICAVALGEFFLQNVCMVSHPCGLVGQVPRALVRAWADALQNFALLGR
jgi:hypothetical protein